ncbi:chaperone protein dnaJ 72-like [Actinidia eriantha]|uniref:chaperone protein dnaJ 72-like n=1 Tax=Actinidia eriantha TaxID=165200 RepID=UPI00258800EF|nr:chaperone protein dnaJ 72-like [Actinidia eriantha]
MDHYEVLGLSRNATKEEIKEAFRKLAMEFHPDKHSHSSNSVRDAATLRFKLASHAYETLIDDRKRADYNHRSYNNNNGPTTTGFNYSSYGYSPRSGTNSSYGYYRRARNGDAFVSKIEIALRYLKTRSFLLNLAFAGVLLSGTVIIDTSRDALWKMHNPGKSFEDAMESVEKAKGVKR